MPDKVTPCFYFEGNAQEAIDFYTSVLPNSEVLSTTYYGPGAPCPEGEVMTIQFRLQGRDFMAINGGPAFKFSEGISMVAYCDDQAELDRLWDALGEGGTLMACGWLTDRFGVAWQIQPTCLPELMSGDQDGVNRCMQALWGMVKLDIAALKAAKAGTA